MSCCLRAPSCLICISHQPFRHAPRVFAQVADAALRPLSQERMRELNVVVRSGGSSSEEEKEEERKEAPGLLGLGLGGAEDDVPILSLDKLGL